MPVVIGKPGNERTCIIKLPCADLTKAVAFQAAYLLRCRKSRILSKFEPIDEQSGKSCIFHAIRKDAALFQKCDLFFGWRGHFPREGRHIACEILRGDRQCILERVDQLSLAVSHFSKFTGKCLLALSKDIPFCLLFGFDQVIDLIIFHDLFVYLFCNLLVTADERGRAAEVMPRRHP